MRKNDSPVNIDELTLNVLGGEFFRKRQISAEFIPLTPKVIEKQKMDNN